MEISSRNNFAAGDTGFGDFGWYNTKGDWTYQLDRWSYESGVLLCRNSTKGHAKYKREFKFRELLL